jgi:cyclohexanone monooxygenase
MGISQNAISFNMTQMFDDQAKHVAYIIREARARQARVVEPTEAGEAAWVRTIRELSVVNTAFLNSCTPGIFNNEGNLRTTESFFAEAYSPGVNAFNELLAEWRARGDLEGLELSA